MIRVNSLDKFEELVEVARIKKVPFQIFGAEREGFLGFSDRREPSTYVFSYLLCCDLFSVYISSSVSLDEKESITNRSCCYNYWSCSRIELKDGIISME